MKISGLTIFLVLATLMSLFFYYTDHKIMLMYGKTCNEIVLDTSIEDLKSLPQERWDSFESCLQQQSYYILKNWILFFASTFFIVLTILSWKIDYLKKSSILETKKKH